MAAHGMRKETNSNAGNTDFLSNATLHEAALNKLDMESVMNTQSCMDQSILAIFADSPNSSEDKSGVDEENESTLLTALTEILDRGENSEGTLSPFDTLPDTELLMNQEHGEHSTLRKLLSLAGDQPARELVFSSSNSASLAPSTVKEESIADRLRRSRLRCRNVFSAQRSDGEDKAKCKGQGPTLPQGLRQSRHKSLCPASSLEAAVPKTEADIEVFTSMSLVNLVKLMHPYSLQVHLEEGGKGLSSTLNHIASSLGKLSTDDTLSSPGEILKYEEPSGDSDEEINVDVSDDETMEVETGHEGRVERELRSVLVNRDASKIQPSREKKRVSFGPIEVTNFDAPGEEEPNQNEPMGENGIAITFSPSHNGTKISFTAPELVTPPSGLQSDNVSPPQCETKPKSLSLQEYRQLRHKRLPLVEKQGNNTAKWPCLPETPTELSPIFCFQGVAHKKCGLKTTHPRYDNDCLNGHKTSPSHGSDSVEAKHSVRHSGLKRARTESKIVSPARPLSDHTAPLHMCVTQSRSSPEKKLALKNSDPPNPVLLPLPVAKPSKARSIQLKLPPITCSSPEPQPRVVFLNRASPLKNTSLLQEIQKKASKQLPKIGPSSPELKSEVLLLHQDPKAESTHQLQEIRKTSVSKQPLKVEPVSLHSHSPEKCQTVTWTKPFSECKDPQHQQCSQSPTKENKHLPNVAMSSSPAQTKQATCHTYFLHSTQPSTIGNTVVPVEERSTGASLVISAFKELPICPQASRSVQNPKVDSGIEATDLTSLLEQFEETQAIEKGQRKISDLMSTAEDCSETYYQTRPVESICNRDLATSMQALDTTQQSQRLQTDQEPYGPQTVEPGQFLKQIVDNVKISVKLLKTPKPLVRHPCQMPEPAAIPEPLGTDVILSTQDMEFSPLIPKRTNPEKPKVPASKAIQIINPRPLPPKKIHGSLSKSPVTSTLSQMHLPASVTSDHDYCISEGNKNLNSPKDIPNLPTKTQVATHDSSSTSVHTKYIPSCETPSDLGAVISEECAQQTSTEHVSSSSEEKLPIDLALPIRPTGLAVEAEKNNTKPLSPSERGRQKRGYRRRSPDSDLGSSSPSSSSSSPSSSSSSSPSRSRSRSPRRKRFRPRRSESSSSSSSSSRSCSPLHSYRFTYPHSRPSRSRSKSWSQSRSPSPRNHPRRWRDVYSPTYYHKGSTESKRRERQHEMRIQKLKAIDERRVVYVGRIGSCMTHDELRERFSLFGEVECVSLHFRDRGDNYGFVTFYNMEDAFAAIENGSKLRRPDERPLDICFGGRRQFCKSTYADLDSNRDVEPSPVKSKLEGLDFDSLLKQAQNGLRKDS